VGVRNYLVEGVSCSGKTSVCSELQRRGHHAIHGDRELAYSGDPATGMPTARALTSPGERHKHHIWDVRRVQSLVAEQSRRATFFCGGSRNFSKFIHLFDEVFVLDVDADTLKRRLDQRPDDDWGATPEERQLTLKCHQSKEDVPKRGIVLDATVPLSRLVDEILARCDL
jgi:broad-specificity NMP kinase